MNPNSTAIKTYGLFRHGETIWNSEKRVQGHGDSPLTTAGKARLREWTRTLATQGWQRILCSDLGRVIETAEIVNEQLHLPLTVDPRLREQHWGEWEGLRVTEVRSQYSAQLAQQIARGWEFTPPGGEARSAVRDRVFAALEDCRTQLPEKKILVICHLGVIKSVIYHIAGRDFMEDEPKLLENDRMHVICRGEVGYTIDQLNIPHQS